MAGALLLTIRRRGLTRLLLLLLCGIKVSSKCPNKCSGHGYCGEFDMCTCMVNWQSRDCSERESTLGGWGWLRRSMGAGSNASGRFLFVCPSFEPDMLQRRGIETDRRSG